MKASSAGTAGPRSVSDLLNKDCFCITLDRDELCEAAKRELDDPEFCDTFIKSRPNLFSSTPVFLPQSDVASMHRIVLAIEAAARLPGYRAAALSYAPEIARRDHGPLGAFMGYDFHLGADGPKLIEINTNAGGAFLNALSIRAQRACCREVDAALAKPQAVDFDSAVVRMFRNEWASQRRDGMLRRIAIVDDRPEEQYLYPEFVLAQHFFGRHGIEAAIADPGELRYEGGRLLLKDEPIDLVYNRLVDFSFDDPPHRQLGAAYRDGAVVVTPNPFVHAIFADKRNLALLCDPQILRSWGLADEMLAALAGVPRTVLVTPDNQQDLWAARKKMFFKPAGGYGSKAVYRGGKLTRRVWEEIVRGGYVAQEFAAPSERMIKIDGQPQTRKTDFRLYVYDGKILLKAARLYQGQTTNFRTPGGGFAPVFAV